jgi:hypothetical protein
MTKPRPLPLSFANQNENALEELASGLSALCDAQLLNPREQMSLNAMQAYAAYEQGVSEDVIKGLVEQRFGIADFAQLARERYDEAMRFLVDLDIRACIN